MYMRSGLAVQKTNELRFLSSRCIFEVWQGTARWTGRERGCRRSRCTPDRCVDDDCEDKYEEKNNSDDAGGADAHLSHILLRIILRMKIAINILRAACC